MAAYAVPAKPIKRTLKLADGSTVTVVTRGDESFHFYMTTDGVPVVEEAAGYRLAPEMKEALFAKWTERAIERNAHRLARAKKVQAQNRQRRVFGYPTSYTGKKKGIVILVNFNDVKMASNNTNEAFNAQFNQEGYSKNNAKGSVHDYFTEASYGKFDLEFDVFGPVTVSKSYSYYGANDSGGSDLYPAIMCQEACKLANNAYNINWKDYDWDSDGYVDQVFFVYAGNGEVNTDIANQLWPHEGEFSTEKKYGDGDGPLTLGGVTIDTYAVSCELAGESKTTMDGIGTACHEFSHCLGIPDFYDTSYSGGFGMDAWDLMDLGSYNGPNRHGEIPCGYSAYERWFSGWLELKELKDPCYIKDMPAINDSPVAYAIYNDRINSEFFILENRQNKGFFKYSGEYTSAHGLLIYHVDYNEEAWVTDKPNNNANHQRMSIIPAGKDYGTYYSTYGQYLVSEAQYKSHLFPGSKNVTELTNTSHEKYNGKLFNKNSDGTYYMNKPLTEIAESNGLISFTFNGGINLGIPEAIEATEIGDGSFTANWKASENAESYIIELIPITQGGGIILSEDMHKLANVAYDGTNDICDELNEYTSEPGWTGSKVYTAANSLKIGSSKASGYLISPTINAPSSGTISVKISAKSYGTDEAGLNISLVDDIGLPVANVQKIQLGTETESYAVTFEGVTTDCHVKISCSGIKKRSYIFSITLYDGEAPNESRLRKAPAKQTIEGITGTSYTFEDLTEVSYKYHVKAVCGSKVSDWSNLIVVEGVNTDETAISAVSTENDSKTEYFTLNGMKIAAPTTPGIYLVKKEGKVQKKLIGR